MVDIRCYGPEYHFLDLSLFLLLCQTEFHFKCTPVIAVATWSHFKEVHVAWLINSETLIRLTSVIADCTVLEKLVSWSLSSGRLSILS